MNSLIKFEYHTYYGSVIGLEIVTDEELDILSEAMEKSVTLYLGSCLGKHSEVAMVIDYENCEVVSDSVEDVEAFRRMFPDGVFGVSILAIAKEALEYRSEAL